jgi:hypothetical protein
MYRTFWVLALVGVACGGGKDGGGGSGTDTQTTPPSSTGDAVVEAVPVLLEFPAAAEGVSQEDFVTVINGGGQPLTITDITFDGDGFVLLDEWDQSFELGPGELRYVDVVYTVMNIDDVGTMTVHSSDSVTPELVVDLSGHGLIPQLTLTPDMTDMGDVEIPCFEEVDIVLENTGTADLTIMGYDFVVSTEAMAFDPLTSIDVPLVLSPGESDSMTVDFLPEHVDPAVLGTLTVQSDDPAGDRVAEIMGSAVYSELITEVFPLPSLPAVDLLFLIDNSCSMESDNIQDITVGIPLLVDELQAVANWQMIEVTDGSGCSNVPILDQTSVDASQQLIDNAFVSSGGDYSESLLSLAATSLGLTGVGDCNEGFLRPGALLYVIVASDERERSGISHVTWLQNFESYLARPEMLTVSAIVDVNRNCGDGSGPDGYLEAANATSGTVLDICTPSWGANLSNIAETLASAPPVYLLPDNVLPESLVVTLDGNVTSDFYFDAPSGVLTLVDAAYVKDVSTLSVDYALSSTCVP